MKHFTLSEFDCNCCGENGMKKEFLTMLDEARGFAGVPFIVTSGFRCYEHNEREGGSKTSSHLDGFAADISAEDSDDRFKIINGLLKAGFTRIGISSEFIHVDSDPLKTEGVMWTYG